MKSDRERERVEEVVLLALGVTAMLVAAYLIGGPIALGIVGFLTVALTF